MEEVHDERVALAFGAVPPLIHFFDLHELILAPTFVIRRGFAIGEETIEAIADDDTHRRHTPRNRKKHDVVRVDECGYADGSFNGPASASASAFGRS